MTLTVRPADIVAERETLNQALAQYLAPNAGGRRFDWLYRENPFGPARVWVAEDQQLREVVGIAALFPRLLLRGDCELSGCVLGDFGIDARYRSLGPALQLQRACLGGINASEVTHGYDFPSATMLSVYRRLAVGTQEQFVRFAKPLRVDRKVAQRVKVRWLARCIGAVANRALRLADHGLEQSGEWTIAPQEEACGPEFTALARKVSRGDHICIARTEEYLNWRFRSHPFQSHRMLCGRRGGGLAGYLTYTRKGEDATIVDMLVAEETELATPLLSRAVSDLQQEGVMTVSVSLLASDPRRRIFERMGFRHRESAPVVLFQPDGPKLAGPAQRRPSWLLMDGDRES